MQKINRAILLVVIMLLTSSGNVLAANNNPSTLPPAGITVATPENASIICTWSTVIQYGGDDNIPTGTYTVDPVLGTVTPDLLIQSETDTFCNGDWVPIAADCKNKAKACCRRVVNGQCIIFWAPTQVNNTLKRKGCSWSDGGFINGIPTQYWSSYGSYTESYRCDCFGNVLETTKWNGNYGYTYNTKGELINIIDLN